MLGLWIMGEQPSPNAYLGLALILIGIGVARRGS
jgi:drug/metabolite transporter (DMT)-like permease